MFLHPVSPTRKFLMGEGNNRGERSALAPAVSGLDPHRCEPHHGHDAWALTEFQLKKDMVSRNVIAEKPPCAQIMCVFSRKLVEKTTKKVLYCAGQEIY